jgi:mannose-6-phosphate isomerase-like protein (cupin superfamily)
VFWWSSSNELTLFSLFKLTCLQVAIMDQIRQLRFEDFKEKKLEQGYREVLERQWEPNIEKEFHRHEYTADAIVIEGEFWLTVEGKTRHLNPGDSFHVPAQVEHKEKYGVAGYVFWVAKV